MPTAELTPGKQDKRLSSDLLLRSSQFYYAHPESTSRGNMRVSSELQIKNDVTGLPVLFHPWPLARVSG